MISCNTIPYDFVPLPPCRQPTPPGRPRLSEEGIRIPYYLSGFVPFPPLRRLSEDGIIKPYDLQGFVPLPPLQGGPA